MLHRLGDSWQATRTVLDGLAAVADGALEGWEVGDGIGDALLEVRRTAYGYVLFDGEASPPRRHTVSRAEARDVVVAILASSP
jgi:hypothetical protein